MKLRKLERAYSLARQGAIFEAIRLNSAHASSFELQPENFACRRGNTQRFMTYNFKAAGRILSELLKIEVEEA